MSPVFGWLQLYFTRTTASSCKKAAPGNGSVCENSRKEGLRLVVVNVDGIQTATD